MQFSCAFTIALQDAQGCGRRRRLPAVTKAPAHERPPSTSPTRTRRAAGVGKVSYNNDTFVTHAHEGPPLDSLDTDGSDPFFSLSPLQSPGGPCYPAHPMTAMTTLHGSSLTAPSSQSLGERSCPCPAHTLVARTCWPEAAVTEVHNKSSWTPIMARRRPITPIVELLYRMCCTCWPRRRSTIRHYGRGSIMRVHNEFSYGVIGCVAPAGPRLR